MKGLRNVNVYKNEENDLIDASKLENGDMRTATEPSPKTATFGLSALDIAKWFIAYGNSQKRKSPMTNSKLQSLLYYAQGIAIKYTGKTLFSEALIAGKNEPIVAEVYEKYKRRGKSPIVESIEPPVFDENDVNVILEDVYEDYGQLTPRKIAKAIRGEIPWKETPNGEVISLELIRRFWAK